MAFLVNFMKRWIDCLLFLTDQIGYQSWRKIQLVHTKNLHLSIPPASVLITIDAVPGLTFHPARHVKSNIESASTVCNIFSSFDSSQLGNATSIISLAVAYFGLTSLEL